MTGWIILHPGRASAAVAAVFPGSFCRRERERAAGTILAFQGSVVLSSAL
jgi:hypothetical protein